MFSDDQPDVQSLAVEAERLVQRHLADRGFLVVPTSSLTGNHSATAAPMALGRDRDWVLPDVLAFNPATGRPLWVEVKTKASPGWLAVHARWEHGIDHARWADYCALADASGTDLEVWVCELTSPLGPGQIAGPGGWLRVERTTLETQGRVQPNWPSPGSAGFVWPRDIMTAVPGLEALGTTGPATSPRAPTPTPIPSAKFSWLHIGPELPARKVVEPLLRRGVRVDVFVPTGVDVALWAAPLAPFGKHKLLEVHVARSATARALCRESTVIEDGKTVAIRTTFDPTCQFEPQLGRFPFNPHQYEAIHEQRSAHVIVRAGAGTGKTHVMVQRALYLLHMGADIEQITLVTFTRAAAGEMRKRLSEALEARYYATGDERFVDWMSRAGGFTVSTLTSFAQGVLRDLGRYGGWSTNWGVRGMTLIRRRFLDEAADRWFNNHPDGAPVKSARLRYQILQLLERAWGTLENRGMSPSSAEIDWGTEDLGASDGAVWARFFEEVLTDADAALKVWKATEQAISLGDEMGELRPLLSELKKSGTRSANIRFLLIDEFQDTDDTQIQYVVEMARQLGAYVFAVGDPKQAIYRFRGAEEMALDELNRGLGGRAKLHDLVYNTRTGRTLLDGVAAWTQCWSLHSYLPQHPHPSPIGPGGAGVHFVGDDVDLHAIVRDLLNDLPTTESASPRVGVLVRTNRQAREVHQQLIDGGDFAVRLWTGNDFFRRPAIRDVYALVHAVCEPSSLHAVLAVEQTPFGHASLPQWAELFHHRGAPAAIAAGLRTTHPELLDRWQSLWLRAQREPPMRILASHSANLDEDPLAWRGHADPEGYRRDLQHLLILIREAFRHDELSWPGLEGWLVARMASDTDERGPGQADAEVVVATVHRVKGLQFPGVVLAGTSYKFGSWGDQFVVLREGGGHPNRFTWALRKEPNADRISSPSWQNWEHTERRARIAEECRLLYVAATRAESRLVIVCDRPDRLSGNPSSWRAFFPQGAP